MRQKIQFTAFLAVCAILIATGIKAGKQHTHCRECNLGISNSSIAKNIHPSNKYQ